jgi:siroheme synthase
VIFMGLASLAAIADGLLRAGKAADTPAAVVAAGTTAGQRVALALLTQIARAPRSLDPPALVVVGEVAALAGTLAADELLGAAA